MVLCVVLFSTTECVHVARGEHVQAHTVEITLARLEHHNKNGSQDDCVVTSLQEHGFVLTPQQERPNSVSEMGVEQHAQKKISAFMRAIITAHQPSSATSTNLLRSRCWSLVNVSAIKRSEKVKKGWKRVKKGEKS